MFIICLYLLISKEFNKEFSLNYPNLTVNGPNCFENRCVSNINHWDYTYCKLKDQKIADVGLQYITSIGLGAQTLYMNVGENSWILDFVLNAQKLEQMPKVKINIWNYYA